MKKWFLLAAAASVLSASLILFSCQKEAAQAALPKTTGISFTQPEQDLLARLKNTNQTHVSDRGILNVIGGDLLGGLEGAAAGSAVPGIGTTAGAVIGCIGGSLLASGMCMNSGGGGEGQSNPENPFDEVGMHHNASLQANLPGFNRLQPSEWTNELLYGYGEDYLATVIREDPAPYRPLVFPPSACLYDLIREGGRDLNIPSIINQMRDAGHLTPVQAEVATVYFLSVLPLSDDEFFDASVRFEAEVLNSGIEDRDKNVILAGLAVGRYSRGFWGGE